MLDLLGYTVSVQHSLSTYILELLSGISLSTQVSPPPTQPAPVPIFSVLSLPASASLLLYLFVLPIHGEWRGGKMLIRKCHQMAHIHCAHRLAQNNTVLLSIQALEQIRVLQSKNNNTCYGLKEGGGTTLEIKVLAC